MSIKVSCIIEIVTANENNRLIITNEYLELKYFNSLYLRSESLYSFDLI